jgi:hypothetical protein
MIKLIYFYQFINRGHDFTNHVLRKSLWEALEYKLNEQINLFLLT